MLDVDKRHDIADPKIAGDEMHTRCIECDGVDSREAIRDRSSDDGHRGGQQTTVLWIFDSRKSVPVGLSAGDQPSFKRIGDEQPS